MVCKQSIDNIFKQAWAHFFWIQLNGFQYCYVTLAIQLNIRHLFVHSYMIKQFYLTHR